MVSADEYRHVLVERAFAVVEAERLRDAHGHLWFAITNIVNDFIDESGADIIAELRQLLADHTARFAPPGT